MATRIGKQCQLPRMHHHCGPNDNAHCQRLSVTFSFSISYHTHTDLKNRRCEENDKEYDEHYGDRPTMYIINWGEERRTDMDEQFIDSM